jgi:hypothetical protein
MQGMIRWNSLNLEHGLWRVPYLVSERRDLLRIQDHLPEETDEQRAPSLQQNNRLFTSLPDTMYGSDEPDPHQNVTDPEHCFKNYKL